MADEPMAPERIVEVLRASPKKIATITSPLSSGLLRESPAAGEWSAVEVLAHLRSCADVWGESIATILDTDHPTIRAVSPRSYIHQTDYTKREFAPSLRQYARQRKDLVATLVSLPPKSWARDATVVGAGAPYPRSIQN